LSDSVAEKRFNNLRQRFGKERRKIMQTMPRFGAAADQPHIQTNLDVGLVVVQGLHVLKERY